MNFYYYYTVTVTSTMQTSLNFTQKKAAPNNYCFFLRCDNIFHFHFCGRLINNRPYPISVKPSIFQIVLHFLKFLQYFVDTAQLASFTCSKSTTETLKHVVKYVQS